MSEQEHQKKPKEHSQPTIGQPDIPNALLPPADKHIFDAFDMKKEPWKQYMERLEQHFAMYKITDAEQQRKCLLSWIGSETYELLRKLFGLEDITNKTFKTLVSKLSDHLEIPKHIQAARHKFYNCKMKPDQSVSDWVADLERLSHECEFLCKNGHCNGSYADDQIRDMVIKETADFIFTSGPSSPELTNRVATFGHSFSNATFTQRTGEQAEELVIIDSPSAMKNFDDSEFSDASLTIDEEVLYPQTLDEFSSDDEQPQPKKVSAVNKPSMLLMTISDNDLPEDATNFRDQDKLWDYNKLIKGPKPRVTFDVDVTHAEENPHNPIVFQDPVYDKSQPSFVQHPGRPRIGEGNDITPNPGKLIKLGNDLKEVQIKMAALGDGKENRKEKMRLSSRMCRLKCSANHEANKIKQSGLEQEKVELSSVIAKVKDKMKDPSRSIWSFCAFLQQLKTKRLQTKVAGQTGEYVNSVLEASEPPIYSVSDSD